MINLKTKNEGMIYSKNGQEYVIHHGLFKVIEFIKLDSESKIKMHIQNKDIDTIIIPFIDTKENITNGCNIRVAYVIENNTMICHGYEVVNEQIPELEYGKLPPHRNIILDEHQTIDTVKYREILYRYINKISNPQIQEFVSNIIDNNWNKFSVWPAASNVHHNFRCGLLLHTVNVVKNAYNIAFNYNDIDLDIVLSSAILHDIGKIYEYNEDGSISTEGKMFDHINIGTRMLFEEYYHGQDSVYSFSERDIYHMSHVILSHHGKLEWGSPRTPATQEAMIVHYADYIDTNMYIAHKELLNTELGQSIKSKYVGSLMQTKISMNQEYDKN